jgi:DNA-binding HxlR family transcriptional regulator
MENPDAIHCPIFEILSIFEKKWALAILKEVYRGTSKFNDLKRKLKGINPSILSRRLAELEKRGLILRKVSQKKPVTVEYSLTEKSRHLFACWPGKK